MASWAQRSESRSPSEFKYLMVERNGKRYVSNEIVVHRFEVGTWADDAIIAAGAPLYEWEQSEAGKWVKEHAVEVPRWERFQDQYAFKHKFAIIARLTEQDQTYFRLKFQ